MKRSIIAFSLILILLLSLSSCLGGQAEQEYELLNTLASNLPALSELSSTVTAPDGQIVTEAYSFYGNSVLYRAEHLNPFTQSGDGYEAPDEYKTVTERLLSAEEIEKLPDVPSFSFSSSVLTNAQVHGASLTAEIINVSAFMGMELEGSDFELTVFYDEESIDSVMISYTSDNGNYVVITYTFQ